MNRSEFAGQRIAVIGLAATGIATATVLRDLGAQVTVYESKPEYQVSIERLQEARQTHGLRVICGVDQPDWQQTDLVVPSPGVPRYAPALVNAVGRDIPVLSEIEVAYRLASAPLLAITGTNGKTTTTALLGAICREAGWETWVAGNIAEDAGVRLPLIQAAVQAPAEAVLVAEISSFQLEWVERFRPHVAAWLNLSADHQDRHQDMDEYARAKARILAAQAEEDYAVLNADDPTVMRYSKERGAGTRWLFSLNGEPQGDDAVAYRDERGYLILDDGYGAVTLMPESEIPIPGRHNVANVLAAAAMAWAFGIEADDIRTAVKQFGGVAHRMEPVAEIGGVRYINNSMCTNPAAVAASVDAIKTPLVAISGGIHKGGSLDEMAQSLARAARHVVLIGQSAPEISQALRQHGLSSLERADSLPEAVRQAAAVAQPGDTVMLVPGCASFDMFSGFEQRGQVFRDAVRQLQAESHKEAP
ncbi:MAG: UDP-N-acetylmuramoyl-L-alanine--D-glutamate ligase [Armatimonadaceae bacterium]